MKRPVGIIHDPYFTRHLTGPWHPETPRRSIAIVDHLKKEGLLTEQNSLSPRLASREELSLAHSLDYIELVEREIARCKEGEVKCLTTGDVMISSSSFEAARLAAGAVLEAIDAVFSGRFSSVFCVVRPPGHHASRSIGMGFCLFNNVVIGALYALKHYPISRLLIVDWDLHHGNGTEAFVKDNPHIFYFSTHQYPLWPGTGDEGEHGVGNILNTPISAGSTSRKAILDAYEYKLTAAMETFKPELVLISAGFDAHKKDPLGKLELTAEDFGTLTLIVKEIANRYASGRLVSVLEGGYDLEALADSAASHVQHL